MVKRRKLDQQWYGRTNRWRWSRSEDWIKGLCGKIWRLNLKNISYTFASKNVGHTLAHIFMRVSIIADARKDIFIDFNEKR